MQVKAKRFFVQRFLNPLFRLFGTELVPYWKATSSEFAFRRLKQAAISFSTVVDVGASYGKWSLEFMRHFPKKRFLLIEAEPTWAAQLRELTSSHRNVDVCFAAAGDRLGTVSFSFSQGFAGARSIPLLPRA